MNSAVCALSRCLRSIRLICLELSEHAWSFQKKFWSTSPLRRGENGKVVIFHLWTEQRVSEFTRKVGEWSAICGCEFIFVCFLLTNRLRNLSEKEAEKEAQLSRSLMQIGPFPSLVKRWKVQSDDGEDTKWKCFLNSIASRAKGSNYARSFILCFVTLFETRQGFQAAYKGV